MLAASCMEIAERQGGKVTSGLFWLGEAVASFLVRLLWTLFFIQYLSLQKINRYHNNIFLRKDVHEGLLGLLVLRNNLRFSCSLVFPPLQKPTLPFPNPRALWCSLLKRNNLCLHLHQEVLQHAAYQSQGPCHHFTEMQEQAAWLPDIWNAIYLRI